MQKLFSNVDSLTIEQVKEAVDEGFSFDCTNDQGQTLLMLALEAENGALVDYLLQHEAPLTADGVSLLMYAILENETGLIEALLAKQVPLNSQNKAGYTALMYATVLGLAEVVTELLAYGARADLVNEENLTALELAKLEGEEACIAILEQVEPI